MDCLNQTSVTNHRINGDSDSNDNWENEKLSQIPFKVLRGHRDGVNSCQFCINDTHILSASDDGTTKLFNFKNTKLVTNYAAHSKPVTTIKVSANSRNFITCSWDKTLCYWDLETGKILWSGEHEGIVTSGDISCDGKLIVSCSDLDNTVKVREASSGDVIHELKQHHTNTPTCCIFSPNSQRIATTGMDKTTKVWDLISKKVTASLSDHENIISTCCFSKNERYLCTGAWDKTLRVFDISTGMYRSEGSKELKRGHEGCVSSCQFSEDSELLVSGGYDKALVLWDGKTFSKKLTMKGHQGWVTDVSISSDKHWVISSSKDKTIRMWNIENCNKIPIVIESQRAMGLKITQCLECGKPFSIGQLEEDDTFTTCVFCRLADPMRSALPSVI